MMDEDGSGRSGRGGAWRNAFLNRHRRSEDEGDALEREAGSRPRSLSRPRAGSRPPRERSAAAEGEPGVDSFNQQAVLDQDRALIEQLTQRQNRGERPAVRKPPPPPKVTPYRKTEGTSQSPSGPPSPLAGSAPASPQRVLESATPQRQGDLLPGLPEASNEPIPTETGILAAALASCREPVAADAAAIPSGVLDASAMSTDMAATMPLDVATAAADAPRAEAAAAVTNVPALKPVVPRAGGLFTSADIDSIMDSFGQSIEGGKPGDSGAIDLVATFGRDMIQPSLPEPSSCGQNFQDVADDFFKSHGIEAPVKAEVAEPVVDEARVPVEASKAPASFQIPDRKALREQINSIDSWLEDDFTARNQLNDRGILGDSKATCLGAPNMADRSAVQPPGPVVVNASDGSDTEIFLKLEEGKRMKAVGSRMSPVTLKNIAQQATPLFPGMPLDKLVRALRLFTSVRYEDHDLYLRILGEIPVQIRGISPSMLIECVRVLWRLRLCEETYVELFSMEAMNMIRSKRRPTPRAPRRAPALRSTDSSVAAAPAANAGPTPAPPSVPAADAPAPFDCEQLVHLGNALSRLGAKHPTRFMDIFQEQLALAIPRLTQEECELVCPTLAMSQLMHDPLRRAFLERCAQVDAGKPFSAAGDIAGGAAPDIAQFQQDADRRKRRTKNFRNIYVIEASVRKETFSFFSSLPADVRTYLDRLHADASQLAHEGANTFSSQVAAVLDQLGVSCDTRRMAGPLDLHVVAKATNPRAECQEVVYECSDASSFYRLRQDDRGAAPQLTAWAKLRQRLLQRLGVQLTHISITEWQQMSEAQRVNYMVKVQSLQ